METFEFSWPLTVSLLIVTFTGNTTHEWEYGTYEFDEQNLSSANSTTEESSTNDNEYIPGTFEGTFTDAPYPHRKQRWSYSLILTHII